MTQKNALQNETKSTHVLYASDKNDLLIGTQANDILHGLKGSDIFVATQGIDFLDGGDGLDVVTYGGSHHSLRMTPASNPALSLVYVADPGRADAHSEEYLHIYGLDLPVTLPTAPEYVLTDVLQGIEAIVGSDKADRLVGNDSNNILIGGHGADILFGGRGADRFVFWDLDIPDFTPGIVDAILDFTPSEGDRIDLSAVAVGLGKDLTFVGAASWYNSDTPYSVFYTGGMLYSDPLPAEPAFIDEQGKPLFSSNEGLLLMADLDGDTEADMLIAIWGVKDIKASDVIL